MRNSSKERVASKGLTTSVLSFSSSRAIPISISICPRIEHFVILTALLQEAAAKRSGPSIQSRIKWLTHTYTHEEPNIVSRLADLAGLDLTYTRLAPYKFNTRM